VLKERCADALPAPRLADAERTDEPAPELLRVAADDTCDLGVVPREKPERRVSVVRLQAELLPLVERHRNESPVLRERLVERRMERARVLGPKRRNADALHRFRRRRRAVEVDLHAVEATNLVEPELFEQQSRPLVLREHPCFELVAAALSHGALRARDQLAGNPAAGVLRMNADPHVEVAAARRECADGNRLLTVLDEPRLLELEETPPIAHLVDAHRHAAAQRLLFGAEHGRRPREIFVAWTPKDEGGDVPHTSSSSASGTVEGSGSSRVGAASCCSP